MKFLLVGINAKYIHSNPAIYSLKAYAGEELEQYIELAEYTINQSVSEIMADIYLRRPEAIGFSCYIWNWDMVRELLAELVKLLPGVKLWLGGPEVSYDAPKVLSQYPQLEGIMVGEGEETFRQVLLFYLGRGTTLANIAGLCLPEGYTMPREVTCMTDIPFLYQDLSKFENKIIYYESSRGCPYRCSYCLSSIDKTVRFRDISVVKRELQHFLDNRVKQVKFVDRTFNCNHEHAMDIWRYIHEHDNGVTNFHFEISADILRDDEIELLNRFRPGLAQLEIGVQSTNPQTIEAIHRKMDVEKLESIVSRIRAGNNIHQHLDLIAGLPYEDYESFRNSFNRVYGMKPDQLQLGFLKVLKGSHMWEKAADYGIQYMDNPPYEVLMTDWLTYEQVLRLKRVEEMVELYYNSNQFSHVLPVLEQVFSCPFDMYDALALFYEKKGYFVNSPARAYRYHVLLDFATEHDPGRTELYKELLTLDMYLRENMKSRPDFAPDQSSYKDYARAFYQEEEKSRKYLPGYARYDHRQMQKMTHLEPFYYTVLEQDPQKIQRLPDMEYLLFDYQVRNPLNQEARVCRIRLASEVES